ncbi:hypothetical protein LOD99_6135 [Oopsacas minuta]|uniref:MATH domain-containing protein n=1 Tax=Oopsacas minuta TaxID=111878 RepID=A0AAV7JMQ0_9METZ|nr:hypothetical protein LOD99_6135 [Oopsacas minuta]
MQSHEQSIQSHELSVQSHEQSIQSHKQSIQSHELSIHSHEQSIQSHKQSIQSHELSIHSHKQSIQSTKQSIQSTKPYTLLSTIQLEWKIKGVKQNIENKGNTLSDPFYVGLYKCQGYIEWNCLNADKVGVFICIMKGAYDDKLHWLIRYKYTLILLNHININNNYETLLK